MKVAICLMLLAAPALAQCPSSVSCPYDGDPMQNTWNCKGVGEQRSCEFKHSKTVVEDGQPKTITHTYWANCPS